MRLSCHSDTGVPSLHLSRSKFESGSSATPAKSAHVILDIDMNTNVVADPAAAHWQVILQLAFPHLHLADIWCLSLTSRAAGEFCRDKLADGCYQHAKDLLFSAVAAKACMPAQACWRRPWMKRLALQTPVEWLLDAEVIPPELLALDSPRYLCISKAPYRKNLLDAGLRITHEAVVTAARKNLTEGLCEWIYDCEACDIELQIHHITRAACCSDKMEMDLNFLSTPDIILDHLYIAVNCIGRPKDTVTGSACKNIVDLCRLPAAAEITAKAIEPLLHTAVQVLGTAERSTFMEEYAHHCEVRAVEALSRLDATNKLSNAALCGLLKAAAETLRIKEMLPLFQLSTVRRLAPAQKVELILTLSRALLAADSAADEVSFAIFAKMLDELVPGIPEASRASLFKALFVVSTHDTTRDNRAAWVAFGVMSTPGMADFSTEVLLKLLWYVLEGGARHPRLPEKAVVFFLGMLCKWPVAAELGMDSAAQLLQLAQTLSYSSETIDKLLQIKAAQGRTSQ